MAPVAPVVPEAPVAPVYPVTPASNELEAVREKQTMSSYQQFKDKTESLVYVPVPGGGSARFAC